jgi:hypothetical protein
MIKGDYAKDLIYAAQTIPLSTRSTFSRTTSFKFGKKKRLKMAQRILNGKLLTFRGNHRTCFERILSNSRTGNYRDNEGDK